MLIITSVSFPKIGKRILPLFRNYYFRLYTGVSREQIKQIAPAQKFEWFPIGEFE